MDSKVYLYAFSVMHRYQTNIKFKTKDNIIYTENNKKMYIENILSQSKSSD